ncbi:hypothetical protein [Pantoea rwandensis]|uniref:Uncharacterized protein n=1 Tax=Pantoea rwandensis TaxID=1076550 RepID=A0A1X1D3P4_9GAMM|nr:hypothetical protein [Pantoea rwandensis]ORM71257.1 hypothetical protein HA51_04130 [Pantoea rwandensis]
MNVTLSAQVYSYVQSASGKDTKSSSSQPATDSSATSVTSPASSQSVISGYGLMMSRLFGDVSTLPATQTQLTNTTQNMDAANFLTKSDLNVLSDLYAQAQDQGNDLRYVDDIARDLGNYRKFGSVEGNFNNGQIFDTNGRIQTVSFTEKDAATASRILSNGNLSGSGLDPVFLKFELDPGYSFSHTASFDYLESVVNSTGSDGASNDQTQQSQFATYVGQGQNNYVMNTASKVTFKTEEPDFISKDGVFTVTETGKKHGFRLEGNNVVQDKNPDLSEFLSGTVKANTLMDYFMNQNDSDVTKSDIPTGLFDFLFSSKSSTTSQK